MRELLFFVASSFWAGAAHAATPGHGKKAANGEHSSQEAPAQMRRALHLQRGGRLGGATGLTGCHHFSYED
jgi:hypothetical protein